jgi:DNA-binding response OmpR family regulator
MPAAAELPPQPAAANPPLARRLSFRFCRAISVPMKVLIIEDDVEAAAYLKKAMEEAGHSADVAHNGDDGYMMADSGIYDALVVDRMLPKRDGLSVISSLRAKGDMTPALVLSALSARSMIA